MDKPEYHLVSFSGGKDSTAMLLGMIERGMKIDCILFCDTGLEFPEMYEHIEKLEKDIGMTITRVRAEKSFEELMFHAQVRRNPNSMALKRYGPDIRGYGWAGPRMRWCTARLKDEPREKFLREIRKDYNVKEYVGIAADEGYRLERLEGKQSSLFYQAVRIVKEMRCATDGRYPRFIVWENVPGAFSSNGGEDFRAVLGAVCSVKNGDIPVPRPPKGKWSNAGCIMADGFSLAWRVFDAQLWGIPQRRKRIYLVADFAGGSAGKILFESEGVSGYSAEGFRAWQRTAGGAAEGSGAAGGLCLNDQGGSCISVDDNLACTLRAQSHGHPPCVMETPKTLKIRSGCEGGGKGALIQDDKSATLSCNNDQTVFVPFCKGTRPHSAGEAPTWKDGEDANTLNTFDIGESRCNELAVQAFGICSKESNAMKSDNPHSGFYEADTARTLDRGGGNPSCNQGGIAVVAYPTYCASKNSHFTRAEKELANTLVATDYKDPPVINDVQTASGKEVFGTLSASMGSKQWLGNQEAFSGDYHIVEPDYIVRRLTPTECARLQGFPDWWCDVLGTDDPTEEEMAFWREVFETHRRITGTSTKQKSDSQIRKWLQDPHSDSAEYRMWGNGVALPNVYFVLSGIVYYAQFPDFLL